MSMPRELDIKVGDGCTHCSGTNRYPYQLHSIERRFKSGPLKGHPSRICVVDEAHAGETGYVRRELLSFRPKIGVWCEVGKAMSSSFCYRFADGAISYIDRDF
jgi:hypothetical protein